MKPSEGFGDISADEFLAAYWDKRPLFAARATDHPILRVNAGRVCTAFVEQAREGDGFTSYHADNVSRRQGRDAVLRLWDGGCPPSAEDVAEFNRHNALIVRGAQRYFSELASFLAGWRPFFNCRLNANVYLTRPGSSAFGTHYDQHHVFALQLHGEKEWFLWPPTVDAPHGRYQFRDAEPEGDPAMWKARSGDLVYIPLGWVHRARTSGEMSVHVTVGVNPPRWLDLIEQAIDQAAGEFSILRHGLPFRFSPHTGMEFFADVDRHLAPIIALVTKDLAEKMQAVLRLSQETLDESATN